MNEILENRFLKARQGYIRREFEQLNDMQQKSRYDYRRSAAAACRCRFR